LVKNRIQSWVVVREVLDDIISAPAGSADALPAASLRAIEVDLGGA